MPLPIKCSGLAIVLQKLLKYVKDVSCVDQLSFVQTVRNVQVAAPDLPVGVRLYQFWETWEPLRASPKVIRILSFQIQPNLTRSPTIISGYMHPLRNSYLTEALHAKMHRTDQNSEISGLLQPTFLSSKAKQLLRPIQDLSTLNKDREIQN